MSAGLDDTILGGIRGPALPAHFYFHVPFCRSKCAYCDFCSVTGADPMLVGTVFRGMEAEVRRWGFSALPGLVETVYVGGGTPSLHAEEVARLLDQTRMSLPLREGAEITVEANPDSLSAASLETLVRAGANRISVGVQAFDDQVLGVLGRAHDASTAREALSVVRQAGVVLATDLMCGIPGQSEASWAESVEEALDAGPAHVSVYPLSVEEGTPLWERIEEGLLPSPDPDKAAEMMLAAADRLASAGLVRYEVANYALPGCESRHNSAYWSGASYAGVGPGAHGMLDSDTARAVGLLGAQTPAEDTEGLGLGGPVSGVARMRYSNAEDPREWLRGGSGSFEALSAVDAEREDIMLGMRLARGVERQRVDAAGLAGTMESLADSGLAEVGNGRWRVTRRGWLLGNEVFGRIWLGE